MLNFNGKSRRLNSGENIEAVVGLPKGVIHRMFHDSWEGMDTPSNVNILPINKEHDSNYAQMERHGEVRSADEDTSELN